MPAVAEHAVIDPVGRGRADRNHRDIVNKEHDNGKDGQTQPAVGHDAVDLVRRGQLADVLLPVAALDNGGNVYVALVGDDGFRIIVHFLLRRLDVLLDVRLGFFGQIQLSHHLVVALEHLDGIPSLLLGGHGVNGSFLNVRQRMLHTAAEGVHGNRSRASGGCNGSFGCFLDAGALQGGNLHHLAAQLTGQFRDVDPVAALAHDINHVDGNDHRDAQLGQLSGQVQVTLQVGAVDDVQDGIRTLCDQVVTRHHFLQRVGGQGVNTGQVGNNDVIVPLQLAFLLLHRNAGPVPDELIGAGQGVEQGCLAGVGVAGERDADLVLTHAVASPSFN